MTAALLAPPPVSSRRISAGVRPEPGAEAPLPAWWGSEDWQAEVVAALDERPELLREHHVSRDAVLAVARGMAAYADHRTGRDCRPTNARLVEALRCSLSVVQRARRVLKGLELVRELIRGRSMMTRAERLAAWRRGSAHRQIAATFALCSRKSRRAPKVRASQRGIAGHLSCASASSVDGDTPPGAARVTRDLSLGRTHLRRRTENEDRRSAPRTNRGGPGGATRRLAEGTRARLGWLHGTSWRRIAPTLARFARAGWTPRDVDLAVVDVLTVRGHRVPAELRHPAAYLAGLLRDLDPAGMIRPAVEADEYDAALRAAAAWKRTAAATSCEHGVPAGHLPHPLSGVRACPLCRQAGA